MCVKEKVVVLRLGQRTMFLGERAVQSTLLSRLTQGFRSALIVTILCIMARMGISRAKI